MLAFSVHTIILYGTFYLRRIHGGKIFIHTLSVNYRNDVNINNSKIHEVDFILKKQTTTPTTTTTTTKRNNNKKQKKTTKTKKTNQKKQKNPKKQTNKKTKQNNKNIKTKTTTTTTTKKNSNNNNKKKTKRPNWPQFAHLIKTAIAYLQMTCNILQVLPQQMRRKFYHTIKKLKSFIQFSLPMIKYSNCIFTGFRYRFLVRHVFRIIFIPKVGQWVWQTTNKLTSLCFFIWIRKKKKKKKKKKVRTL